MNCLFTWVLAWKSVLAKNLLFEIYWRSQIWFVFYRFGVTGYDKRLGNPADLKLVFRQNYSKFWILLPSVSIVRNFQSANVSVILLWIISRKLAITYKRIMKWICHAVTIVVTFKIFWSSLKFLKKHWFISNRFPDILIYPDNARNYKRNLSSIRENGLFIHRNISLEKSYSRGIEHFKSMLILFMNYYFFMNFFRNLVFLHNRIIKFRVF